MALKNKQNNKSSIAPKRRSKYCGLAACPCDILGWLRIFATIMLLTGALGIIKGNLSFWHRLLKPIHFPPVQWCWILLALSIAFYLFHIIKTMLIKNKPRSTDIYDRPVVPQQWRSF